MDPTNEWSSTQNPHRRRVVQGIFRYDKEVLVGPRGSPPGIELPRHGLSKNKSGSTGSGGMAPGPQGYHVLTPLQVSIKNPDGTHSRDRLLWINRGWIPKTMVPDPRRGDKDSSLEMSKQNMLDWNRPEGKVTVMAIRSELERTCKILSWVCIRKCFVACGTLSNAFSIKDPKLITPEHDYSKKPPQLFWLDQNALKAVSDEKHEDNHESIVYMTQVVANTNDYSVRKDSKTSREQYPLVPPVTAMAEFKTSPIIHMGYATTWYGLSAAGVYMTRKLITRGRG